MIPRDKLLHLALGVLWVCTACVVAWVQYAFGVGPAIAASTTAYAVMYEFSQWFRKDGNPEFWDAFCTAAPGFMVWALLEAMK